MATQRTTHSSDIQLSGPALEKTTIWNRIATSAGLACVLASFVLMSTGVQVVRADNADPANMSVDPALEANLTPPVAALEKVAPFVQAGDQENVDRPGVSGVETQPGVITLNTRGYNYGPRTGGSLDPAAMAQEALAK